MTGFELNTSKIWPRLYCKLLIQTLIEEDINACRGDPSKVTIWGQSPGTMSVGFQILAFGGLNDSLFRATIADSGGPLGAQPPARNASYATWNSIVDLTGCASVQDQISCLHSVSLTNCIIALNHTSGSYSPSIMASSSQPVT